MQKIEIISKQSCILCHLTFLCVQFKYSVQPCILIKLCCLIPFILKCKFIYLLLSCKWSALDILALNFFPTPRVFLFGGGGGALFGQKERINEKIYCFTDLVSKPYSQSRGGSRIFFRRGCARLLSYFNTRSRLGADNRLLFNTNKPHSFFFLAEYQLY